ncbi:MAG TPA: alcohol dehydrogenase catalytic domain-containing protein [Nitrososphaerales archaeon]|nr:alcohol dehydrogenase catalytic domain-containing protein [Nitrososphaerales archaeon]
MQAAVFYSVQEGIKVKEVASPKIAKANDVLIRVHSCGMCGTDLATLEGRNIVSPPLILGHEVAGEVFEIGSDVKTVKPGNRVTIDPNVSCGVCYYCRSNHLNLCPNMISLGEQIDGGYAEFLVAPESAVFKFPDSTPWDVIPLAEPLSDVVNGVSKAQIRPGESAVVYGAGTMGLLWLSLLKRSGAGTLISVEPRDARARAALKVGADHVIDPKQKNPVEEVFRLTNGRGADVSAELIGRPETVELAIKSAAYGGRVVIMGVCRPDAKASFNPFEIMRYERKIFGSYIANGNVDLAIEELSKGFIKSDVFITHKVPLKEIDRAINLNMKGESVKTLILPAVE